VTREGDSLLLLQKYVFLAFDASGDRALDWFVLITFCSVVGTSSSGCDEFGTNGKTYHLKKLPLVRKIPVTYTQR
jgi:hypothetical protein